MKSITAVLLTAVLSLLLVGEAQALGDRGVALKTLSAHNSTYKRFQQAQFSPQFISGWNEEAVCVNEILEGVDGGPMNDEDKFFAAIVTYALGSIEYGVGASSDRPALVQKSARFLDRKAKNLQSRSESKRGRFIAKSLRGHARSARYFLRGVKLDFCAVRDAIGDTYTLESFEAGFEASFSTAYSKWINSSSGLALIAKGQEAMTKVRPRISGKRINRYSNLVVYGFEKAFPSSRVAPLDVSALQRVRSLVR